MLLAPNAKQHLYPLHPESPAAFAHAALPSSHSLTHAHPSCSPGSTEEWQQEA